MRAPCLLLPCLAGLGVCLYLYLCPAAMQSWTVYAGGWGPRRARTRSLRPRPATYTDTADRPRIAGGAVAPVSEPAHAAAADEVAAKVAELPLGADGPEEATAEDGGDG